MRTGLGFAAFTLAFVILHAGPAAAVSERGDTRSGVAASEEVGYLTLTCDPAANVSIDGEAKGPTPIANLALPVGPHQITLVSLDGKLKRTLGVKIVKGETKRLNVSLGP